MIDIARLKEIANRFDRMRIMVVGDLMLDQFVETRVTRISPEAPVPVAEAFSETFKMGGAANVVNNATSLGSRVVPVGIVGDDDAGRSLRELLKSRVDLDESFLLIDPSRPTTVKTRIMSDGHQLVRVDKEETAPLDPEKTARMIEFVRERIGSVDAIIVSDYDKGVITPEFVEGLTSLAGKEKKPIVVDPKIDHFLHYRGVQIVVPNLKEASEGSRIKYVDEESVERMGRWILDQLKSEAVLITRGKDGMLLVVREGEVATIPTLASEVYDVTGAGDTVASIVTLALAAGSSMLQAAIIANCGASVVVRKVGTATLTRTELVDRVDEMEDEILNTVVRRK